MEIKDFDKFLFCKYINEVFYCKKIKHEILNSYASVYHCGKCKYFKLNDEKN